ncbi:RIP metalloprotease RseP [Stenoxybacter acetivorans]|uniref:RIP metalloprotease RseP n=1 Tax=Stenoxybacter acetivorans TaxID=422441 RepID=UPI00056CD0A3|nr:RIP metalloprotease RseP [Stenoxybacter acetivorans]
MLTLGAFILAILVLVSLHEFGHFLVARLFKVKVTRFSIGFGTPFWKKKRGDTEWCLAPIPLGGYVKMVDTREGEVAEADLPYAFDKQHPAKRIAIVAAGPLTNLILAVLLYTVSFSAGITEIRPWVGTVTQGSIAAQAGFQAGDRIEAVNGAAVNDWTDAQSAILLNLDAGKVNVAVKTESGQSVVRVIDVADTQAAKEAAKTVFIGMLPFRMLNRVGVVEADSPAAKAGLQKGDALLAVDGKPTANWLAFTELIRRSAGQKLTLAYERGGKRYETTLRPDSITDNNKQIFGRIGMGAMNDEAWQAQVQHLYVPNAAQAFQLAVQKTGSYMRLTLEFFGKLITGNVSLSHISGPVTIADVAGKTAAIGWQSYVEFLALVSVSLGILNLLPIPVLDGGHLLYYAFEWIRGKPLSERLQQAGMRVGIALMLMLMCVAFFNDITRLLG